MNDSSGPFIGSVEAPSFAFTWSLQKPSTSSVRSKNINTQGPSLSANDITHDTFFSRITHDTSSQTCLLIIKSQPARELLQLGVKSRDRWHSIYTVTN
jgi:hypothetical protein